MNYLPNVYDSCSDYGNVKEEIISNLNYSVPITSVVCYFYKL